MRIERKHEVQVTLQFFIEGNQMIAKLSDLDLCTYLVYFFIVWVLIKSVFFKGLIPVYSPIKIFTSLPVLVFVRIRDFWQSAWYEVLPHCGIGFYILDH